MSILILDVGTTSMRGILYDNEGKKLSVCQLPNHPRFEADGIVNESPDDWRDNTLAIMKSITSDPAVDADGIEAVAITSQRSSITPLDADGEPLLDTIMWQDIRNKAICDELKVHNAKCFAKTGSNVNTVFSGSKMTWVRRERPDVYERTAMFLNIPEYINYLMTGERTSDYTYASRSGLLNLHEKKWDAELLALYDVDPSKLCSLIEPGQTAGRVTPAYAAESDLPEGIPVIHAGGDQQCAAVGQGVTRTGLVSVVLGTGGFTITACDEIPENLTDNVICNASGIAGSYVIEANILAMSAAYDWFIREFYGMKDGIDYAYIEQELAQEADISPVLAVPYVKGRGVPDWNAGATASFSNITLATRRSEVFKALMEGLFMELNNQLDSFRSYTSTEKIFASGGLTKSRTLVQLLSDVTGLPVICRDDKESTAYGAYLIARAGLGHFPSVDAALEALAPSDEGLTFVPDQAKHKRYLKKQAEMNACYQRNL